MPLRLGLSWAPPFQSVTHEHAFQQEQDATQRRLDQLSGTLAMVLFVAACLKFWRPLTLWHTVSLRWAMGLAMVSLCSLPLIWCTLLKAPASYSRHRLWVVTGLRLSAVLVPGMLNVMAPLGQEHFPQTFTGQLAMAPMALMLPKYWLAALGFRLPFYLHCIMQAAMLAVAFQDLPGQCSAPYFQQLHSTQFFANIADWLGAWAGVVFAPLNDAFEQRSTTGVGLGMAPAPLAVPADTAAQLQSPYHVSPAVCSCVLVLGVGMALLGFVLPSLVVALSERGARAAYVGARLQDGGWVQADLRAHYAHDWISAIVLFVCMMPFWLRVLWQVVLLAAVRSSAC